MSKASSRIPGFYRLPVEERRRLLRLNADLSEQDMRTLDDGGIDTGVADRVVENAVGVYALPLGVGLNFVSVRSTHTPIISPSIATLMAPRP